MVAFIERTTSRRLDMDRRGFSEALDLAGHYWKKMMARATALAHELPHAGGQNLPLVTAMGDRTQRTTTKRSITSTWRGGGGKPAQGGERYRRS
jgi:hypothetical protein